MIRASLFPLTAIASLFLAPLAAQSPNLTPAAWLPGSAVIGPSASVQQGAALSQGAATTLLVFEDKRSGDYDLFGVRIDTAGAPLDAVPFAITKDPGDQTAPKVVWNGQSWLVVYKNQVPTQYGYFEYAVAARRVAPDGAILDAVPIQVAVDGTGGGFAVTTDGNNWAVSYTGYSAGNSHIGAKRIAGDGTVLDPAGVVVVPATYYVYFGLDASFVGNEYVFTYGDNGTRARRFTPQLAPIDPAPLLLTTMTGSIATSGSHLFLAAAVQTPQYTSEVVGVRYDAALQAVDAAPLHVSGSAPGVNHTDPLVEWDGSQWIVSWLTAGTQVGKLARVSSGGAVLDFGGVPVPDNDPSYLYGWALGALPGGGALFAWHDGRNGANDVFGVPFGANAAMGTERVYSVEVESQSAPRVAPGPGQYLVTFKASLATGSRILAQRVDSHGNALDAEPIEVASAPHQNLDAGGAAWNGTVYLVVWSDSSQGKIFARRILLDGTLVDPAPILALLGGGADVGALGDDFLVTGLRAPTYWQYVFSYGARVRGSDGAVLDNPALGIGGSFATRARVATLGGRWLVVTESHATHDENYANVFVHFVDAAGAVSGGSSIGTFNIQNWGMTDVASSGTSALVLAQTGSNWTNTDVHARRVLPDGSMPAPSFNATGGDAGGQSRPTVAWTGAEYVIAFESLQNNSWYYDYEPDVYGVRVSEGGALLDPKGFPLWNGEDWEQSVHARSLGDGRALFAVSAFQDPGYGSFRVALRGLRPDGLTNYGTGTAGCYGPQRMDANGEPAIGNAGFALLCEAAPVGALGLALVTNAQDLAGSDPFGLGVLLHVGLLGATEVLALDMPSGLVTTGAAAAPIPNDPLLVGKRYFAQAIWPWPAWCALPPFGLSSSDGLELVLQAP